MSKLQGIDISHHQKPANLVTARKSTKDASRAPWRDIEVRTELWENRQSIRGRIFSWSTTPVHHLTLSCGHVKIYRGHTGVPDKRARCQQCLEGG